MSDSGDPTREAMERAIRRLNVLEYVILGFTALLAILGGALVAWLLSSTLEVPFRLSWFVASLLLFVVPGAVVYGRERRAERSLKDERERRARERASEQSESANTVRDADG